MNSRLLIAAVLILLLGVGVAVFFMMRPNNPEDPQDNNNPFGEAPNGEVPTGKDTLTIALQDGTQVPVPNFLDEQPDWAGPEAGYQVAGTEQSEYHIMYFSTGSSFLISLFAEPLGEVRRRAESELRSTLKLSDQDLCKLNIDVAVSDDVNAAYSGRNLGLSFCPGSVVLP